MTSPIMTPDVLAVRLGGLLIALSTKYQPHPQSVMAPTADPTTSHFQDDVEHLRQTMIENLRAVATLTFGKAESIAEYSPPGAPQIVLCRTALLAAATLIYLTGDDGHPNSNYLNFMRYEKEQEKKHIRWILESIESESGPKSWERFKASLASYGDELEETIRGLTDIGTEKLFTTAMVKEAIHAATEDGADRAEELDLSTRAEYLTTETIGVMVFNVTSAHVHALNWQDNFARHPGLRDIHLRNDQMLLMTLSLAATAAVRIRHLFRTPMSEADGSANIFRREP